MPPAAPGSPRRAEAKDRPWSQDLVSQDFIDALRQEVDEVLHWSSSGARGAGAAPGAEAITATARAAAQRPPASAGGPAPPPRRHVAPQQPAAEWVSHKRPSKDVLGHALFGPPERTLPPPPAGQAARGSEAQMYEKSMKWNQKVQEKNNRRALEKEAAELSTLRNPQITAKSKYLATSYKSGPPPMQERARRRLEEARAKEESECTFRPQVCKGSRQMHATMLESGVQWHNRLQGQGRISRNQDRMGCRARRDAHVDADCTFSPRVTQKAQMLVRDGRFEHLFTPTSARSPALSASSSMRSLRPLSARGLPVPAGPARMPWGGGDFGGGFGASRAALSASGSVQSLRGASCPPRRGEPGNGGGPGLTSLEADRAFAAGPPTAAALEVTPAEEAELKKIAFRERGPQGAQSLLETAASAEDVRALAAGLLVEAERTGALGPALDEVRRTFPDEAVEARR